MCAAPEAQRTGTQAGPYEKDEARFHANPPRLA